MKYVDDLEVLTPKSERWRLFADALNILGEHMGCPTRRSPLAHAGARALLHQMGQVDVDATIARLVALGGHCDCEIAMNVDPGMAFWCDSVDYIETEGAQESADAVLASLGIVIDRKIVSIEDARKRVEEEAEHSLNEKVFGSWNHSTDCLVAALYGAYDRGIEVNLRPIIESVIETLRREPRMPELPLRDWEQLLRGHYGVKTFHHAEKVEDIFARVRRMFTNRKASS